MMRAGKLICLVACCLVVSFSLAYAGPVRIILNAGPDDACCTVVTKPEPKFVDVPDIDGEPCVGMKNAVYYIAIRKGVIFSEATMAPGGKIGWHKSATEAPCYIVSGQGDLLLENGEKVSFKTGDVLVTGPDTWHAWENTGNETVRIIYVLIP